jgi:hypothetical protein
MNEPIDLHEIFFDRRVDHLVRRFGTRAVAALLRKLGQKHMIRTSIDLELEQLVTRPTPEMLGAAGADRLPPVPLHLVPQ